MARIVVSGYMIRHPVPGNMLAYFHYILGLHRLGHDVVYVEESGWPRSCYNTSTWACSDDPAHGLQVVRNLFTGFGMTVPICFVNRDSREIRGLDWPELKDVFRQADLLLNVGGVCWLPEFRLCRRRVLVDMDPFFTQTGKIGVEGFGEYHAYFSYGANIGRRGCTIPTNGIDWRPTVPPVVPEIWSSEHIQKNLQSMDDFCDRPFTTIANWNAYGGINHGGEYYGQKDEEFLRLLELPRYTSQRLELAISGSNGKNTERFRSTGWLIRSAAEVSIDVPTYQNYIINSRGEFSAAKHAYVKTHSGWFSDRSVCYMSAGLPVILQDTGFSDWLPTGMGVLAFASLEEAVQCIEKVNADYSKHSRAAREIAENTFIFKEVLPRLVELGLRAKSILDGRSLESQGSRQLDTYNE